MWVYTEINIKTECNTIFPVYFFNHSVSEITNSDMIDDAIWISDCDNQPLFDGIPIDAIEMGFHEYVSKNFKKSTQKEIMGRVAVEFIIEKDGSVSNAKIIRGIDPLLDADVLQVINSSPKWTPGKMNGNPVRVKANFVYLFESR